MKRGNAPIGANIKTAEMKEISAELRDENRTNKALLEDR
jgi:hypothetical protein